MANTDSNIKPSTKNPPRSPRSGALLRPFTSVTAKQAAEASARARAIRKQVRTEILEKLVSNMDFGEQLLKAIKTNDSEKIDIINKALTIVGLTHNQSDEYVSRLKVDATTDNKTAVTGKIEFVLPE